MSEQYTMMWFSYLVREMRTRIATEALNQYTQWENAPFDWDVPAGMQNSVQKSQNDTFHLKLVMGFRSGFYEVKPFKNETYSMSTHTSTPHRAEVLGL